MLPSAAPETQEARSARETCIIALTLSICPGSDLPLTCTTLTCTTLTCTTLQMTGLPVYSTWWTSWRNDQPLGSHYPLLSCRWFNFMHRLKKQSKKSQYSRNNNVMSKVIKYLSLFLLPLSTTFLAGK